MDRPLPSNNLIVKVYVIIDSISIRKGINGMEWNGIWNVIWL